MRNILKYILPYGFVARRDTRRAESRQTGLYRAIIGQNALVFDVGANVGNRIAAFLNCSAKVVAVEPQPDCVRVLGAKYGDKVKIVEAAVGSEEGVLDLHISSEYDTVASLSKEFIASAAESKRFGDRKWNRKIPVKVTTIDALIAVWGEPSFVKIDVEGFEGEVLRGLSRPLNALSFEWTSNRPQAAAECIDYLDGLGMRYFQISFGESMSLGHRTSQSKDVIKQIVALLGEENTCFGDIYASRSPIIRI